MIRIEVITINSTIEEMIPIGMGITTEEEITIKAKEIITTLEDSTITMKGRTITMEIDSTIIKTEITTIRIVTQEETQT